MAHIRFWSFLELDLVCITAETGVEKLMLMSDEMIREVDGTRWRAESRKVWGGALKWQKPAMWFVEFGRQGA